MKIIIIFFCPWAGMYPVRSTNCSPKPFTTIKAHFSNRSLKLPLNAIELYRCKVIKSKKKSSIWYPASNRLFLKIDSDAALLPSWFNWQREHDWKVSLEWDWNRGPPDPHPDALTSAPSSQVEILCMRKLVSRGSPEVAVSRSPSSVKKLTPSAFTGPRINSTKKSRDCITSVYLAILLSEAFSTNGWSLGQMWGFQSVKHRYVQCSGFVGLHGAKLTSISNHT